MSFRLIRMLVMTFFLTGGATQAGEVTPAKVPPAATPLSPPSTPPPTPPPLRIYRSAPGATVAPPMATPARASANSEDFSANRPISTPNLSRAMARIQAWLAGGNHYTWQLGLASNPGAAEDLLHRFIALGFPNLIAHMANVDRKPMIAVASGSFDNTSEAGKSLSTQGKAMSNLKPMLRVSAGIRDEYLEDTFLRDANIQDLR